MEFLQFYFVVEIVLGAVLMNKCKKDRLFVFFVNPEAPGNRTPQGQIVQFLHNFSYLGKTSKQSVYNLDPRQSLIRTCVRIYKELR